MLYSRFIIDCSWDAGAGVWRASNSELPYSDSAPSYEQLCRQANANLPAVASQNGFLWAPGVNADFVMIRHPVHVIAGRPSRSRPL